MAETFHVLPTEAARDLYDDAEGLSVLCMSMLSYAQAKAAYDAAEDEESLKAWKKSAVMQQVIRNDFELKKERRKK